MHHKGSSRHGQQMQGGESSRTGGEDNNIDQLISELIELLDPLLDEYASKHDRTQIDILKQSYMEALTGSTDNIQDINENLDAALTYGGQIQNILENPDQYHGQDLNALVSSYI
uniref:GAT domain-containing protein n=1 Tax=Meloidogyne hapla TaxID=6305 RepID=A0A1I8BXT6_MELHA